MTQSRHSRASGHDSTSRTSLPRLYLDLGKVRLTSLVVFTAAVGFVLGDPGALAWSHLLYTIIGVFLAAAGANGLNQWIEVERDRRMLRTRHRPLPSGELGATHALVASTLWVLAGVGLLTWGTNLLAGALAATTALIYVLIYTPMKTRSTLCTLVGAVVGAIPPMIGWAAAAGRLDTGAWVLAAILFIWQIPHFLALAWMLRQDYELGGFRMLPIVDRHGGLTARMVVLYSLALLPIAAFLSLLGTTGPWYAIGSVALGLAMVLIGLQLLRCRTDANARRVFLASIIYLPLLLTLMLLDRAPEPLESPWLRARAVAAASAEQAPLPPRGQQL